MQNRHVKMKNKMPRHRANQGSNKVPNMPERSDIKTPDYGKDRDSRQIDVSLFLLTVRLESHEEEQVKVETYDVAHSKPS